MNTQTNHEIVNLQKDLLKAALEKEPGFMEENLHSEFVFTSPRAMVLNKETFIQNFVLNPAVQFDVFQLTEAKTITMDHTAILHCLVQVKPVGQPEFWERVSFTLVQEADKWQTISMNATFVPDQK
ncbi:DUF4440 domain-containing protein [Chitinophagaceae bacterium MMS25-I14]